MDDAIHKFVGADLLKQSEELVLRGKNLAKDIGIFSKTERGQFTFEITIRSLWGMEGEEDIKITHTGELEEGIKRAAQEFKKTNMRSDVQGEYRVYVIFPNKSSVLIEERFYENFCKIHNALQVSVSNKKQ